MRIIVGVDGSSIAGHFGHSEDFLIYTIEDGKVFPKERVSNPGNTPEITPPQYVVSLKVDVAIGGTIGKHAYDILADSGLDTVFGATGEADAAVETYLKGELKTDAAAIFAPGTPCC